ncbi:hypothetical protein ACOMHN_025207 [Nucella lapillus]
MITVSCRDGMRRSLPFCVLPSEMSIQPVAALWRWWMWPAAVRNVDTTCCRSVEMVDVACCRQKCRYNLLPLCGDGGCGLLPSEMSMQPVAALWRWWM